MRDVNALHWLNLAHSLLEGDGTFEWNGDPFSPTDGYQVGGIATYKNPETPELLARWLHEQSDSVIDVTQVGSWRDPSDGTLYIDVSDHWLFRDGALAYAARLGEKAIWNWAESEAIDVPEPSLILPTRGQNALADHAESWAVKQGREVPPRDSEEWRTMYLEWIDYAFESFR